jgi:succinyl-CoA synthetase beta subunit
MNLHEYQAKKLFTEYGIPVPDGIPAETAEAAHAAAIELGGDLWVVKAQVHAGGRGKAGGVKLAHSAEEVQQYAGELLGARLVTHQSGSEGLPVDVVYVEAGSDIERELYLSMLVDREVSRVSLIASAAGGMDIEQVAADTPEQILTVTISPESGVQDGQAHELSAGLGLDDKQSGQFADLIERMYELFVTCDASLVEVNPLIISGSGDVLALDAKINIEDNALFRQERLMELRDPRQEDEKEREAAEHDLNYVSLDGDIACMVNGAGLAMATMDLIKLHGGEPANFLDVGGGATSERVANAFKLILSNQNVRAILVNIFGGIVRCDLIAQGIISAVKEVGVRVPVVVRLEGTNVIKGRTQLAESGLDIISADDLTDAAQKVVALAAN